MKRVLCYGDSNTWGWNPESGTRYPEHERWPGVLQLKLGNGYRIIEEGLNGRTTVWDDPIEGYKSGKEYLIPCLETHKPLDGVIIMLGSNDLKQRFSLSAFDIAQGMGTLLHMITQSGAGPNEQSPRILCACPARIGTTAVVGNLDFREMFAGAAEKSRKLAGYYRQFARLHACEFFDAGEAVSPSSIDGLHLEASEHLKLGKALAPIVERLLA